MTFFFHEIMKKSKEILLFCLDRFFLNIFFGSDFFFTIFGFFLNHRVTTEYKALHNKTFVPARSWLDQYSRS